jgi:hypothetical protein
MVMNTNQLVLYTTKIAVCSEILTEHSTQCEHHEKMLNIKLGGT